MKKGNAENKVKDDVKKVKKTPVKKTPVKKIQDVKKTGVKKVQKKKTRKKQVAINWNAAKALYLTDTSFSYSKIAELFGCAEVTVEKRAKKEGWVKLRKTYGEKIIEKASDMAAQTIDEANKRHLQQWSEMSELILTRLRFIRASAEKGVEMKDGKIKMLFDSKEMKQVTEALKIVTEGERTARGLPNSVIRNQNENKDVDDFADLSDEELDELLNDTSEDTATA